MGRQPDAAAPTCSVDIPSICAVVRAWRSARSSAAATLALERAGDGVGGETRDPLGGQRADLVAGQESDVLGGDGAELIAAEESDLLDFSATI